jgi:hypothetical protein
MNTQELVNALVPRIHAALSGDPDVARAETASQFFFPGTGTLTLSYAEAVQLREASILISKFFPKVSEDTCDRELKRFCCRFIPELQAGVERASIAAALRDLLGCLESFTQDFTTVYVEVCGLDSQLPEWTFRAGSIHEGRSS